MHKGFQIKEVERLTMKLPKLYLHHKPGWLYLAIGRTQLFSFFGAGGWVALSPQWLLEKSLYEIRRRLRVAFRDLSLHR